VSRGVCVCVPSGSYGQALAGRRFTPVSSQFLLLAQNLLGTGPGSGARQGGARANAKGAAALSPQGL